jgi:putative hydrolase of the HAD superfamily
MDDVISEKAYISHEKIASRTHIVRTVTARALLVDYGGVISRPQPTADVDAMVRLTGLDERVFTERYWQHRPAHDRGVEARAYWSAVVGHDVSDDRVLEQLVRIDVESWSHLNEATLEVLRAAHERGRSLALLSNAPHEMAAVLHAHPAFTIFEALIFSSEIGVVKPSAGAFRAALQRLSREPGDVLFIDDRPDNVDAAIGLGLQAILFTSAAQLAQEIGA